MSANRIFTPSAVAGGDVAFRASAAVFDAAIAAELLRQRIGGVGVRQTGPSSCRTRRRLRARTGPGRRSSSLTAKCWTTWSSGPTRN